MMLETAVFIYQDCFVQIKDTRHYVLLSEM